jgi:hypothetical protein
MSSNNQNKFLKNETLFQTLYRINKQVKSGSGNIPIGIKSNIRGNNINHQINLIKPPSKVLHNNNICHCPKTDNESVEPSEYCAVCHGSYGKTNNTYSTEYNIEPSEYSVDDKKYSETDSQNIQSKSNNSMSVYISRNSSCDENSSFSKVSGVSCQSSSLQPGSTTDTNTSTTFQTASQEHKLSFNKSTDLNNALTTSTTNYSNDSTSNASYSNVSKTSENTDLHSSLFIKIISNLEERLNSLETKKNKKKQKI